MGKRSSNELPKRREQIIPLLEKAGGVIPIQRLHSLLLLLGEELKKPPYRFVPSASGPWSFQLEADLEKLRKDEKLVFGTDGIKALEKAERIEDPQWEHAVYNALSRHSSHSDTELLERFEGAPTELPTPTLLTIGYEGRALEDYMNELLRNGVNRLCDLRKNPVSRKFGFSKKMLEHACSILNMSYAHFPSLGIPKEMRKGIDSEAARQSLLDHYEKELLPQASEGIQGLEAALNQEGRIALTCYEADPSQCHRSRLAKALLDRGSVDNVKQL